MNLRIYYRPDNYPYWVKWKEFVGKFNQIGLPSAVDAGGLPTLHPGFAPRQSFGKPPEKCDQDTTSRILSRGYQFQVKLVGTGHVVIDQFRVHAQRLTERSTAKTI